MKKTISVLTAMLLMLLMCACGANNTPDEDKVLYPEAAQSVVELGKGNKQFKFTAIDAEGTEFGLYVNKVNGIYAQYEVTGTYWAFYVDGVYASAGIDMTEITENTAYEIKIEQ